MFCFLFFHVVCKISNSQKYSEWYQIILSDQGVYSGSFRINLVLFRTYSTNQQMALNFFLEARYFETAQLSSKVIKKLPKSQFLNWIYSSFSFLFFSLAPSNIPYIIPVLLLLHILCSFAAKQKGIPSDVLHNGLYLVFYVLFWCISQGNFCVLKLIFDIFL